MRSDRAAGEEPLEPESLNRRALVALALSTLLGVGGLFALPTIQAVTGLAFLPAFGLVLLVELVAVVGIVLSVLNLHTERTLD